MRFATFGTAALLTVATGVQAQTVLFDLGNDSSFRGASVTNPAPNGTYWNSVWNGAFYQNVIDSEGNATDIDFGFTTVTGTDYFNGPSGATQDPDATVYDAAALGDFAVDEAVYDYYVNSTFQIQGLDVGTQYEIQFFGSHKFNTDNTTVYTAYTDDTFTTEVDSTSLVVGVNGEHNQDTFASLTNLTSDANGIIFIGFEGENGNNGYLNAFSITPVSAIPEPAAVGGIAALGLLSLRRRRGA